MANVYCGSVEYTAVTAWSAGMTGDSTANGGRGTYVRATAPAVNSERVFRCTTSGTAHAVTEPTWAITKNATTADNTIVWTECTGQEADQVSGTWKAPHARLKNAMAATWGAAGDTFYVAHDHAETQAAAMTNACPGTTAAPCNILCVLSTGTVPPVAADLRTTATITTTGDFDITNTGGFWCEGITFNNSTGAVTATLTLGTAVLRQTYKNCALNVPVTTASSSAVLLAAFSYVHLINTSVGFGNTGHRIPTRATLIWEDTATPFTSSIPATIFVGNTDSTALTVLRRIDLSGISSSNIRASGNGGGIIVVQDCKIATPGLSASPGFAPIIVQRSDSAGTNYRDEYHEARGDQTVETTIVRTGGASNGVTPLAWKVITTSSAMKVWPFEALPMAIWTNVVGSVTVTVYGIWGGGAVPNNDEIWMDVQYLGSATSPIGSVATTNKATLLTTAAAVASDTSTWGGSTTAFKLTTTVTTGQAGMIYIFVKCGLASQTYYIDPKPVLT